MLLLRSHAFQSMLHAHLQRLSSFNAAKIVTLRKYIFRLQSVLLFLTVLYAYPTTYFCS